MFYGNFPKTEWLHRASQLAPRKEKGGSTWRWHPWLNPMVKISQSQASRFGRGEGVLPPLERVPVVPKTSAPSARRTRFLHAPPSIMLPSLFTVMGLRPLRRTMLCRHMALSIYGLAWPQGESMQDHRLHFSYYYRQPII